MHRATSRAVLLLALPLLAACASGGSGPTIGESHEQTRLDVPGSGVIDIRWDPEHSVTSDPIPASADKVFSILPEIYGELGIDPGTVDQKQRVFGNRVVKIRRELGRVRLSRYIDCGSQAGIPTSETYNITLSILTQVVPDQGNVSTIRTQVEGSAYPEGVSGHTVRCETTGQLERRIAKMAMDRAIRG